MSKHDEECRFSGSYRFVFWCVLIVHVLNSFKPSIYTIDKRLSAIEAQIKVQGEKPIPLATQEKPK